MNVCLGASAALIESEGSSFISDSPLQRDGAEAVVWPGLQLVFSTLGMLSASKLAFVKVSCRPVDAGTQWQSSSSPKLLHCWFQRSPSYDHSYRAGQLSTTGILTSRFAPTVSPNVSETSLAFWGTSGAPRMPRVGPAPSIFQEQCVGHGIESHVSMPHAGVDPGLCLLLLLLLLLQERSQHSLVCR